MNILRKKLQTPDIPAEHQEKIDSIKDLTKKENRDYIQKQLEGVEFVTCQGDQNPFNILVNKETGRVTIVDYERTCWSFKGDEIGCLFYYSILDIFQPELKVYPDMYPSEDLLRDLAEYYVVFFDMDEPARFANGDKFIADKKYLEEWVAKSYKTEDFEKKVKEIIRGIKLGMMTFSYLVAIGAFGIHYSPDKGTNMLNYAFESAKIYQKIKDEFTKNN